jgi:long-chain acyl-CoA synthetase
MSFFAISAAGGIIVPLSTHTTPYEAAGYVDRADVSIVVTSQTCVKRLFGVSGTFKGITVMCVGYDIDKGLKVETHIGGECEPDEENGDVALMVPTSGTTGAPKIVLLTDDNLISNMAVYRLLMGFKGDNVVYCALLFRHIYCICAQILTHISLGDMFVITDRPFFIRDFLKAVHRAGITAAAFVPTMAILMAEYPEPDQFNLESLKYITISGAKMPKLAYSLLSEKYRGTKFINTYGMSEAGSRISIAAPFPDQFPVESVGRPMPSVSVRIVDDEGNNARVNCVGEIVVKGPGTMKGYYKQPDLTAETIVNGWLKTGDLGKLDEDGNLFVLARIKDIIISGGENICPFEIEECLIAHPAVREAAVVGQKDRLLQEVPCAFIVKSNHSEKPAPVEIVRFCKTRLSSHKMPRSIEFVESLPRLGTSKIDRKALKKMADNLH